MGKIHKLVILLLLFSASFMLTHTSKDSYTFWAGDLSGSDNQTNSAAQIGSWIFGPNVPNGISYYDNATAYNPGNLVWYEGQLWQYNGNYTVGNPPSNQNGWIVYNDLNWYSTVIYREDDLVYYNGNIYRANYQNNNLNPEASGINGPWSNVLTDTISWVTGEASELNTIVYHNGAIWIHKGYYTTSEPGTTNQWALFGNLAYSANYVYSTNDIVLFNGSYYRATDGGWATGSTPGTNSSWQLLTVPTFNPSVNNSIPNNTTHTLYNGILYVALQNINGNRRNIVPGSQASKGLWNAISTQQWQQYNTYQNGALVMYQGDVYELINNVNSSDIPGTTQNSWNGLESLVYKSFNVYSVGDFVVYNSFVYQVANATNANQHAPGTFPNAWNRLDGYDWYFFNTYVVGDVVFYDNTVYVAIASTTNHQPNLPGSSIYWQLYQS